MGAGAGTSGGLFMAAGAGSSLCPRGAREHSSHREGPVPTTCSPPKAPPAQRIGAGLCRGFQASRRPRAPELNLLFSPALKGLDFRLAERAVGVPFVTDSPSLSPEAPSGTVQVPEAPCPRCKVAPQEDRCGLVGAQTGRVGACGLVFPSEVAQGTPVPARRVLWGQESASARTE